MTPSWELELQLISSYSLGQITLSISNWSSICSYTSNPSACIIALWPVLVSAWRPDLRATSSPFSPSFLKPLEGPSFLVSILLPGFHVQIPPGSHPHNSNYLFSSPVLTGRFFTTSVTWETLYYIFSTSLYPHLHLTIVIFPPYSQRDV